MRPYGMIRTAAVTTLLVAGLGLAACSDEADQADDVDDASGDPTSETLPGVEESVPGATEPSSSDLLGICDYLETSDVADSFGVELQKDGAGGGSADEQGFTWKYDFCSWETPDEIEVGLDVATAEYFPDGVLACPPLAYLGTPGEPVEGLDADAWWVESGFNEQEGTLRLCTETHVVDIDVDRPSGTVELDVLREQATDLAAKVLLRLET